MQGDVTRGTSTVRDQSPAALVCKMERGACSAAPRAILQAADI